jgi:sterol desaturase/sphingolipid hydroxylase (fatty acid hydroxylase superfamily)
MFDATLRSTDIILSLSAGAVVGLLIAIIWKIPGNWLAFAATAVLNALSPWIMTTTWFLAFNDAPKLVGSPFLLAMFGAMNIVFLLRVLATSRSHPVSVN